MTSSRHGTDIREIRDISLGGEGQLGYSIGWTYSETFTEITLLVTEAEARFRGAWNIMVVTEAFKAACDCLYGPRERTCVSVYKEIDLGRDYTLPRGGQHMEAALLACSMLDPETTMLTMKTLLAVEDGRAFTNYLDV